MTVDKLLTPTEAANYLSISTSQLLKLTIDGELPFINVGRGQIRPARRYERADLEAFVASRKFTTSKPGPVSKGRIKAPPTTIEIIDFVGIQARRSQR